MYYVLNEIAGTFEEAHDKDQVSEIIIEMMEADSLDEDYIKVLWADDAIGFTIEKKVTLAR